MPTYSYNGGPDHSVVVVTGRVVGGVLVVAAAIVVVLGVGTELAEVVEPSPVGAEHPAASRSITGATLMFMDTGSPAGGERSS
jgi:hypothetical protein